MTFEEAVEWFGSMYQLCTSIKICPQNATRWKKQGYIPWKQQFRIAQFTEGELMPDDTDPYPGRPKKPKQIKDNSNAESNI